MNKAAITFIKSFFLLTLAFVLHRLLIFNFLADLLNKTPLNIMKALCTGWMSDVWVSYLLALGLFVLSVITSFIRPNQSRRIRMVPLYLIVFIYFLIAAQYAYVKFYHFQMIPLHLPYLWDWDFLQANSQSAFEPVPIMFFCALVFLSYKVWVYDFALSTKKRSTIFATISIAALAFHALNIRYRVNWYIPDALRTNLVENFVLLSFQTEVPKKLTAEENGRINQYDLSPAKLSTLTPQGDLIKQHFKEKIRAGQRPFIIILLVESLRTYDFGVAPTGVSLTPQLDALAAQGILFTNHYSQGTVTRAGQESLLCPFLSSENNSLMRTRLDLKVKCLPQLLKNQISRHYSFWLHGGVAAFDSQVAFWQRQGISQTLSLEDFPEDSPRTGWGISDRLFLKRAAQELSLMHQSNTEAPFFTGMLLTVTNHIPWQLPSDAPNHLPLSSEIASHPSYNTVAYSDFSIGEFVANLKQGGLWQNTLLFITGDHGNQIPAYRQDLIHGLNQEKNAYAELASHVPLIVSGGITEYIQGKLPPETRIHSETVSHNAVFSYIATLLDLKTPLYSTTLFAPKNHTPVIVDLGSQLYFPEKRLVLNRSDVLQGAHFTTADFSPLFYRYFMLANFGE